MSQDTLQIILILATLVLAGIAFYKTYTKGEPITVTELVETVKEAVPVAKELQEVAIIGVQAAEQLRKTGKLPSNDVAFQYALNFVKKHTPGLEGIDNDDIVAAIESAVFMVNTLKKQELD